MTRCRCGRFVRVVGVVINGLDDVVRVDAICGGWRGCGRVQPVEWNYDELAGMFDLSHEMRVVTDEAIAVEPAR